MEREVVLLSPCYRSEIVELPVLPILLNIIFLKRHTEGFITGNFFEIKNLLKNSPSGSGVLECLPRQPPAPGVGTASKFSLIPKTQQLGFSRETQCNLSLTISRGGGVGMRNDDLCTIPLAHRMLADSRERRKLPAANRQMKRTSDP